MHVTHSAPNATLFYSTIINRRLLPHKLEVHAHQVTAKELVTDSILRGRGTNLS